MYFFQKKKHLLNVTKLMYIGFFFVSKRLLNALKYLDFIFLNFKCLKQKLAKNKSKKNQCVSSIIIRFYFDKKKINE